MSEEWLEACIKIASTVAVSVWANTFVRSVKDPDLRAVCRLLHFVVVILWTILVARDA